MDYQVDVSFEYQRAKSIFLRWSFLFSFVLFLVIIGDVLLITLSHEDYLVNFIIASVITVLFSWGALYFFTIIYSDVNAKYRYFKGYESGLKETEEVEFLSQSAELCHINGVYAYPLYVRYKIGLNVQDKVIFTFKNNLTYQMGDKLTITTYQRVLIQAEKHL